MKEVDSSLESGDEEIHVEVNRERALQAGLSSQIVARVISSALSTRPVTYFKSEDREIGLVVQYREEDRETLDQLKKMNIRTPSAALPIASFASFTSVPGPQTIEREDRRSKLVLQVDTGGSAGSFAMMGAIGGMLAKLELPPGYSFNFGRNFTSRPGRDGLDHVLHAVRAAAGLHDHGGPVRELHSPAHDPVRGARSRSSASA